MDADDDLQLLAANMVELRKSAGLSQTALAELMVERGQSHWRQTTVSRVERCKQGPTYGELRALREILGPELMAGTAMAANAKRTMATIERLVWAKSLNDVEASLRQALETIAELRGLLREEHEHGEH